MATTVEALPPLMRDVLEIERRRSVAGAGSWAREARERLGLSPTGYHQLLLRVIDLPQALAYDPALVARLRRVRDARRRARSLSRLGVRSTPG